MPETTIALTTLLGLPNENSSPRLGAGLQEEDLESIKAALHSAQGWSWGGIEKQFQAGFSSLLNIDLMQLISAAWAKYDVLAEYGKQKGPEQIASVELLDHSMEVELHPYLEIYFAGLPQPKRLEFTVTLDLTLKAIKLNIENGVIKSVEAGSCEGEAGIEINGIECPKKPSFGPFDLPGKIGLGRGIPIV